MLMQDNHSFDNYFGTYPGADGIPAGVCQRLRADADDDQGCVKPFRLGTDHPEDLSQGIGVQKRQYDGGRMDGFVAAYRRLGLDGTTAMGYYDGRDIPYYLERGQAVRAVRPVLRLDGRRQPRELPVLGGGERTGEPEAADEQRGLRPAADDLRPPRGEGGLREVLRREPGLRASSVRTPPGPTAPASWSRCPCSA